MQFFCSGVFYCFGQYKVFLRWFIRQHSRIFWYRMRGWLYRRNFLSRYLHRIVYRWMAQKIKLRHNPSGRRNDQRNFKFSCLGLFRNPYQWRIHSSNGQNWPHIYRFHRNRPHSCRHRIRLAQESQINFKLRPYPRPKNALFPRSPTPFPLPLIP